MPAVLGVNARLAKTFARAWNVRVSPGALLYTGSPEGAGTRSMMARITTGTGSIVAQTFALYGRPS